MTKTAQTIVAKALVAFVAAAMLFTMFATPAKAATSVEDLQKMINDLMAQIAALQGSSTGGTCVAIAAPLTIGAQNANVTALQNYLISAGHVIPAGATGYFGTQTQSALAAWQAANGVTPAVGYYGPVTAAAMAAKCVPTTGGGSTGSTGDLEGGAGSVDSYELMASLNNEEVGEDAEDVEVAGLELEVDEASDIEITAVRLVFDEGTAASDFEDYAAEVSIWLDGEEVARVDGDEFNDDNAWTSTVSLDDAIIRADEVGELVVAVTGISNLDSNDATDTWTVDFRQIRFMDADGATISEDPSTGTRTFSFETYATAANTELTVSSGDEDINDARVINVHATDDTDDVEVLSFEVEIEGNSDVTVDDIPVLFTSTEATGNDPDDLAGSAGLWLDGEEIASENFLTSDADDSAETITFDDLNLELEAGETYEFIVTVNLYSIADALDAGDTISADLTATEVDAINAEDESGEDLAAGDLTGTATGGTHSLRDSGIMVELVSTSAVKTTGDASATQGDSGLFKITFDVTAFDSDVYIDKTAPDASGGATESDLAITGAGTVTGTITSPSGATEGTDGFLVEEGETEQFTITVNIADGATDLEDGFFAVEVDSILYALTDVDGDIVYTFNMEDFKTEQIYLDDNGA